MLFIAVPNVHLCLLNNRHNFKFQYDFYAFRHLYKIQSVSDYLHAVKFSGRQRVLSQSDSLQPVPVLRNMILLHPLSIYFLRVYFNIALTSTPVSLKFPVALSTSYQTNFNHESLLPYHTISLSHYLTVSLSHRLTISLSHSLTISLSHCLTISLSRYLTVSLSHCLAISLSHYLIVSLSRYLTVSLSHCLTISLSHCLAISLSHYLIVSLSISLSHCLTVSLSHCLTIRLTITLSHCLTISLSHSPHSSNLIIVTMWCEKYKPRSFLLQIQYILLVTDTVYPSQHPGVFSQCN